MWAQGVLNSNAELQQVSPKAAKLDSWVAYLSDAFYDLIRTLAKGMALVIAARHFLWLWNWSVDVSSKTCLSKLPFKDKLLFGKAWDKLVKDLGETKGASSLRISKCPSG